MKNHLKILGSIVSLLITLLAQASGSPVKPKTGIFGVCDCMPAGHTAQPIDLRINPDQTFTYTDNSDPAHALSLTGTWTSKGNIVRLQAANGNTAFHRKWKYTKNGQCIKSRYKLNFRRICLISPC